MHPPRPGHGGRAALAIGLVLCAILTACGRPAVRGAGGAVLGRAPAPAGTATPAAPRGPFGPLGPPGAAATPTPAAPNAPAAADTPTARPTPADPYSVLDPFAFFDQSGGAVLVKEDLLNLEGREPKDALLTISAPPVISGTNIVPVAHLALTDTTTALAIAAYDPVSSTWKLTYRSPGAGYPGRAAPLPSSAQGQNLLSLTPPLPVIQLRTETTPTRGSGVPSITLRLYGWKNGTLHALTKRPAGANADQDAVFTGAADVQLIDIDDDGRAEVVVDDGGPPAIWKWDGARFVPR